MANMANMANLTANSDLQEMLTQLRLGDVDKREEVWQGDLRKALPGLIQQQFETSSETLKGREVQRQALEAMQRQADIKETARGKAFERMLPFLQTFTNGAGTGAGAGAGAGQLQAPERFRAFKALEESTKRAGKRAESEASGILARRGIFKSGPAAATTARIRGETAAAVAGIMLL